MGLIKKLFGKYLIFTNVGSLGLMMGFGDTIEQRIEYYQKQKRNPNYFQVELMSYKSSAFRLQSWASSFEGYTHNYVRTLNMTCAGLAQGPFLHFFYKFLDRYLPGKKAGTLVKKIIIDQGLFSPWIIFVFFVAIGVMEKRNLEGIWEEIKLKFVDTVKMDTCFWPPIQIVNFILLPAEFRVIYLNTMVLIYNVLLSHIKHDRDYDSLDGLHLQEV